MGVEGRGADSVRGNGEEGVEALREAFGVLGPELVLKKNAHGVHADGFGGGEFAIVKRGVEGLGLEHLQLVDGVGGDIVRADKPGQAGVPVIGLLLGPACLCRSTKGES